MGPVGILVKKYREALSLNKTDAAVACGFDLPGYSKIEGGIRHQLWPRTSSKVCRGLKIPPAELTKAMDEAREEADAKKLEPAIA